MIWLQNLAEHRENVAKVLEALRDHSLYCSPKKTSLFCTELDFLGHHISRRGVEADGKKVDRVLDWPVPRSSKDVRAFLGLVRYIANFLPKLAEHTSVLSALTTKEAEENFVWRPEHFAAFEAIKKLVTSRECLTSIDHRNMGKNRIFVSCDASDACTGALLSYGETLETARPVAFESQQLHGAELNYPVHEKELYSIVRALKKWRVDLIGVQFDVYTDHRTLENFQTQKHLSRRQARWQEELAQFSYDINYIPGEDNTPADSLSRYPPVVAAMFVATRALCDRPRVQTRVLSVGAIGRLRTSIDAAWMKKIREGYSEDSWTRKLAESLWDTEAKQLIGEKAAGIDGVAALKDGYLDGRERHGIAVRNGLLYVGERLVIPRVADLREGLFALAHDSLGHFGAEKSYAALQPSYYWPHMRKELMELYVPGCEDCQRNKTLPRKPPGPLHPLPIPDQRCDSVAIDFIGPLPEDDGNNCIVTMTDRLNSDLRAVACRTDISAEDFAALFFRHWF